MHPSQTSAEARASIASSLGPLQDEVYSFFLQAGSWGLTTDELQEKMGRLNQNGLTPRVLELRKLELIINSGHTRNTRSGRRAIVWIAK